MTDTLDTDTDTDTAADGAALVERGSRLHRLRHSDVTVWVTMLVASVASLVASFVLSIDALTLAENPNADLGCNINSVISCGTVAGSWQSSLLGFPNAFLGLITEPVVITLAVASLAGVRFPRWFMLTAQVVYTLGLVFAYWLFHQAMFEIGALCPWCLLITLATTLVFFEMTYVNIRDHNFYLPARTQAALTRFIRSDLDVILVVVWVLVLVLAVVLKYGEALFS
ncbi:MAG: vitamin K epoxide reductase family protein [Nocardioides sp.]